MLALSGRPKFDAPVLIEPEISKKDILEVLGAFGLRDAQVTFLPSGDANSAVYPVSAGGRRYLLKLRCGDFAEIAATIPVFLRSKGLVRIMAPIASAAGRPWIRANSFDWMLYPWFEGKTGFECPLSETQWVALGETMRQVHTVTVPTKLAARVPRESLSARYRDAVRGLDAQVSEQRRCEHPTAEQFAAFWARRRGDIWTVLKRAEQLARAIPDRAGAPVLCHSDLHAGNVLVDTTGQITIVDWDNPVFARKERDLMFVGGGVGGAWNNPHEREWFFRGYGPADIDLIAITFYRYERIVIDLAEYGQRIMDPKRRAEDREHSLRKLATGFEPGNVVDMAHRSYLALGQPVSTHL